MSIFTKLQNFLILSNVSGSESEANIDFFCWRAIKSTFNISTKMFDPSKDRSWPKVSEKTMILQDFEFKGSYGVYKLRPKVGNFKMENN